MDIEFSLTQEQKEQVQASVDEIDELLELAEEAIRNEDKEEALRYFDSAGASVEELDVIFKDVDGYPEQKDFWRSGMQAVKEGRMEEAVEDMRKFIENFK
ncbi:hypothetical protein HY224_03440 [Candidatus Uhrbacteria bacterium]|nr:hypothetical protein [Candidatus Uhrbacteria bacterium]